MSYKPKWGVVLFFAVVCLVIGIMLGLGYRGGDTPENTLDFLDLNIPAITEPVVAGSDTFQVQTRWVPREDSTLARQAGWVWRNVEAQTGKWAVSRRTQ